MVNYFILLLAREYALCVYCCCLFSKQYYVTNTGGKRVFHKVFYESHFNPLTTN